MTTPNHLDINIIKQGIEELKSLKINTLGCICTEISNSKFQLNSQDELAYGGVYAFWWTGDKDEFKERNKREFSKKGPSGADIKIEITDEWLNQFEDKICLYIGKTHRSINSRMSLHLRLSTPRSEKSNTSGQLKRGLQELFSADIDVREIMLNKIGLSYFILNGDENSVNRFYLEDKAIGEFYPLINVDIER